MGKRVRCEACRHVLDNHWRGRGCTSVRCDCRADPLPAPEWTCALGHHELDVLLVMASHGQRGVAAAELLVETFPAAVLPDGRAHADVRAGADALADLLHALRGLLEHGHIAEPARRWGLGVPVGVLEDLAPAPAWRASA